MFKSMTMLIRSHISRNLLLMLILLLVSATAKGQYRSRSNNRALGAENRLHGNMPTRCELLPTRFTPIA